MFIRVLSDLHIEFLHEGFHVPELPQDAENTLVLAGDICVTGKKLYAFLDEMCHRFRNVIFVPGNHEYYHNAYAEANAQFSNWQISLPNLYVLINGDTAVLENVLFIGATLWTQTTAVHKALYMNDFRCIKKGPKLPFTVMDTWELNCHQRQAIKTNLQCASTGGNYDGIVVITHHAPLELSVAGRFRGNDMNEFFVNSGLEGLFDYDIRYWIHGHTHDSMFYKFNGTHVIANPKGYGNENPKFDPELSLKV